MTVNQCFWERCKKFEVWFCVSDAFYDSHLPTKVTNSMKVFIGQDCDRVFKGGLHLQLPWPITNNSLEDAYPLRISYLLW